MILLNLLLFDLVEHLYLLYCILIELFWMFSNLLWYHRQGNTTIELYSILVVDICDPLSWILFWRNRLEFSNASFLIILLSFQPITHCSRLYLFMILSLCSIKFKCISLDIFTILKNLLFWNESLWADQN